MDYHARFCLKWVTEDEPEEEWLPGEQHTHEFYCNNKFELFKRYRQAVTEQGYDFDVYVWNWNQYCLTNMRLENKT